MLVSWLMDRVNMLEKQLTPGLLPSGMQCPFEWPGSAISWTCDFINAVPDPKHHCQPNVNQDSPVEVNTLASHVTPGEAVDLYIAGVCSRSPGVDPLANLRSLLFDLNTVLILHTE